MCSLINKQLLLTAYAYLFIMEQQKAQQGSEVLQLPPEAHASEFERERNEFTKKMLDMSKGAAADASRKLLECCSSCGKKVKAKPSTDSQWRCDGVKLPGGCVQGCPAKAKNVKEHVKCPETLGWTLHRCSSCDLDYCIGCHVRSLVTKDRLGVPLVVKASNGLKFRKGPSLDSDEWQILTRGTKVYQLAEVNSEGRLEIMTSDGRRGFVSYWKNNSKNNPKNLEPDQETGRQPQGESSMLKSGSAASGPELFMEKTLRQGEPEVKKFTNDIEVRADLDAAVVPKIEVRARADLNSDVVTLEGWVFLSDLQNAGKNNTKKYCHGPEGDLRLLKITSDQVEVRQTAALNSDVLARLPKESRVTQLLAVKWEGGGDDRVRVKIEWANQVWVSKHEIENGVAK